MKLTKQSLKRIIKEELKAVMNESDRFHGKIPQELWAIGDYEDARDEGMLDSLRSYSDEDLEMKIEQLREEIDEDPSDPNVYLKEELINFIQNILDQGVHQRPMNESAGDPEYDREYDLVQNNIKTVPGFLDFAMRSLESSYENRFYTEDFPKANIGFYFTLLGQHLRNGKDSYGGTVEGHIASIEGKLAEHPDLLTPAGRGRLDALLDHLKQNY
jgi:hypothetical protein